MSKNISLLVSLIVIPSGMFGMMVPTNMVLRPAIGTSGILREGMELGESRVVGNPKLFATEEKVTANVTSEQIQDVIKQEVVSASVTEATVPSKNIVVESLNVEAVATTLLLEQRVQSWKESGAVVEGNSNQADAQVLPVTSVPAQATIENSTVKPTEATTEKVADQTNPMVKSRWFDKLDNRCAAGLERVLSSTTSFKDSVTAELSAGKDRVIAAAGAPKAWAQARLNSLKSKPADKASETKVETTAENTTTAVNVDAIPATSVETVAAANAQTSSLVQKFQRLFYGNIKEPVVAKENEQVASESKQVEEVKQPETDNNANNNESNQKNEESSSWKKIKGDCPSAKKSAIAAGVAGTMGAAYYFKDSIMELLEALNAQPVAPEVVNNVDPEVPAITNNTEVTTTSLATVTPTTGAGSKIVDIKAKISKILDHPSLTRKNVAIATAATALVGAASYLLVQACSKPSFDMLVQQYIYETTETNAELIIEQFCQALEKHGYTSVEDKQKAMQVFIEAGLVKA